MTFIRVVAAIFQFLGVVYGVIVAVVTCNAFVVDMTITKRMDHHRENLSLTPGYNGYDPKKERSRNSLPPILVYR